MTGRILVALSALSLIACAPAKAPEGAPAAGGIVDGPHSAPAPSGPDTPVASPADRPAAAAPAPPLNADDPCEAKRFSYLVGKPKEQVPTPPPNRTWRVHSTEDAVTEDYNPARLNIVWDAQTGVVREVKCG